MKYKFENFNVELLDPKIEAVKPSYILGSDTVKVTATLNANENKLFGVYLGEMKNTENWGDSEVMDFALQQLEKFKV
tara:strand:+ start:686 stop:916 length:231 start_codon:yes stop_codon:yes gene_type:complete